MDGQSGAGSNLVGGKGIFKRSDNGALRVGKVHGNFGAAIFHITTDTPHGRYSNAKARRLLDWAPQDLLEGYWRKPQE